MSWDTHLPHHCKAFGLEGEIKLLDLTHLPLGECPEGQFYVYGLPSSK